VRSTALSGEPQASYHASGIAARYMAWQQHMARVALRAYAPSDALPPIPTPQNHVSAPCVNYHAQLSCKVRSTALSGEPKASYHASGIAARYIARR